MKLSANNNLLIRCIIEYNCDNSEDKLHLKLIPEYIEVFGNNTLINYPIRYCENDTCLTNYATSLTINENCRYFAQAIDYGYIYYLF